MVRWIAQVAAMASCLALGWAAKVGEKQGCSSSQLLLKIRAALQQSTGRSRRDGQTPRIVARLVQHGKQG